MRPEALAEIKYAFEFLEVNVLADGRDWVLGGTQPGLGDIEGRFQQKEHHRVFWILTIVTAVWPFHWLKGLNGALPADLISAQHFPKTFAWIERFDKAAMASIQAQGKAKTIKGKEAVKLVSSSTFAEEGGEVDFNDPSGLKKGQEVEVWPIDSGFNHKDRGALISLSTKEVVLESETNDGEKVRIHTPRHGFRIRSTGKGVTLKL